jgi:hypothetical protein
MGSEETIRGKHILVVEDEPLIAGLIGTCSWWTATRWTS